MFGHSDLRLLAGLLLPISVLAGQPSAAQPVAAPLRDLKWGQLNFLHTTDIHGWFAGHLREPSYSADYGDYISFAERMRERAESEGNDLLVIDTGDRIEGNGLYDASDPKGKYTFDIFGQQKIDLLCSGNHELYKQNSSENEYDILVPMFPDNYVASNLDIIDPKTGEMVPLAQRYRKFTTKNHGIRIMAFGFIFDFTGNYNNTKVQPVEETIKEAWFQEAIREEDVDLFLVIGHAPVRSPEFNAIFREIRSATWDTPIQFFGGHLHTRDYKKFDSKAYGLASGRFMETIGFQSISGIRAGGKGSPQIQASPSFARKYIDNNLYSYYHHTGLNQTTFPTSHGTNVSHQIKSARTSLKLDQTYGCTPHDLWMSRVKYPDNSSIFTWLEEQVLPDVISEPTRAEKSRLAIINTGAIRFDILKGPFTRDSTFIVSPFTSAFRYIRDVPYDKAKKILPILNNGGPIMQKDGSLISIETIAPPEQQYLASVLGEKVDQEIVFDRSTSQVHLGSAPNLVPGYTTKDDAGDDGDDTIHQPITFYRVPNVIQSVIHPSADSEDPETVDFVFLDFLQQWILLAFRFTGAEYSTEDTDVYIEGENLTTLLARWVSENWKDNC